MIRRPPRSTLDRSSAASDVYKRQHIPDRPNQFLNTFDLCFTTTPSRYKYTISPPIGNSDHNLVALNYNTFSPAAPPCPKRNFWHFNRANWGELRCFLANYSW